MKKQLTLLILLLGLGYFAPANAENLSQYATNIVQQANHLANEKKYPQAIKLLNKMDLSRGYDKAYVARRLGVLYWQNGQNAEAIKSLAIAVNSSALKDSQAWTTQKMLADLLLMDQQYQKSLGYYSSLTGDVPQQEDPSELWLRIAQVNYQLSRWNDVITAVKQYEHYHPKQSVSPLSLKLGAEVQLKMWNKAGVTAANLIELEPNKISWWRQLVAIQLRQNKTQSALNTLALAKLKGLSLSQKDIQLLAQLYAQAGIPLRAAQTMEQLKSLNSNINLLTQQASYWQQARAWDRAVDAWLQAASKDNKYRWNAIQILIQQGNDRKALSELNKVKTLSEQAKVSLVKAQAYYRLNEFKAALAEAKRSEKLKDSEEARSWVQYLTEQLKSEG